MPATPRRKSAPVDPNETPRQRYIRLCEARVGSAIESTRKIALLANPAQYEYTPEDTAKVKAALQQVVDATVKAFERGRPTSNSFKL